MSYDIQHFSVARSDVTEMKSRAAEAGKLQPACFQRLQLFLLNGVEYYGA